MNLQGKTAIVTGGNRDIGRAISLKLASLGARVVINYRNHAEKAEETYRMIREQGGEALLIRADVTHPGEVEKLLEKTIAEYGDRIDVLVNNAGGLVARKTLPEMDVAFWEEVMDLNAKSVFLMTKAVAPYMSSGASIINVASQAGRDGGGQGAAAYAASKGAVMTFTRAIAKELGPQGIRINSVCPGMIATSFHNRFTPDEVRARISSATPLRREGTAAEVADLVAFLASGESTYITGANVDINGGLSFS